MQEKLTLKVEHFTGIHDGFPRDPIYRESQLAIGWTQQKCKEMDELAKENHAYCLTAEEKRRYQNQWYFTLNKPGKNGPMNLDQIFELLSKLKIVYTTNQGNKLKSFHRDQQRRCHSSSSTSWWEPRTLKPNRDSGHNAKACSICAVFSLVLEGREGSLSMSVGLQSRTRGSLLRVVS